MSSFYEVPNLLEQKKCRKCGQLLVVSEFSKRAGSRDGLQDWCKSCNASHYQENRKRIDSQRRRWIENNPDAARERNRRNTLRKYSITPEQFDDLLAAQRGRCAICKTSQTVFHVDHDHACCPGKRSCGKCIRGLLCSGCNTGLGSFAESADTLDEAATYLRQGGTLAAELLRGLEYV